MKYTDENDDIVKWYYLHSKKHNKVFDYYEGGYLKVNAKNVFDCGESTQVMAEKELEKMKNYDDTLEVRVAEFELKK